MRLKSFYYAQLPGRKNDALRMGYYLIEKVSRVEIKMNKQNAFASAYWHPSEASFHACFAVRINLSTLTNRLSEGPKELSLRELENNVIHIKSNVLTPSSNSEYRPTYKIIWELKGHYQGEINPVEFLNDELEYKWKLWKHYQDEMQAELEMMDQISEEEGHALNDLLLVQSDIDEEQAMLYELYLQEQDDSDILLDYWDDDL